MGARACGERYVSACAMPRLWWGVREGGAGRHATHTRAHLKAPAPMEEAADLAKRAHQLEKVGGRRVQRTAEDGPERPAVRAAGLRRARQLHVLLVPRVEVPRRQRVLRWQLDSGSRGGGGGSRRGGSCSKGGGGSGGGRRCGGRDRGGGGEDGGCRRRRGGGSPERRRLISRPGWRLLSFGRRGGGGRRRRSRRRVGVILLGLAFRLLPLWH